MGETLVKTITKLVDMIRYAETVILVVSLKNFISVIINFKLNSLHSR